MTDRRDPGRQRPRAGGRRKTDRPWTTRDCADEIGVDPEYIRAAINLGVWSNKHGRLIQLEAEYLPGPTAKSKGEYRVHFDRFVEFLKQINWSRIPLQQER